MPRPDEQVLLVIKAPNGDVREVDLGDAALVIGRDESADIRVDDPKVSRRHAAFRLMDGEPYVEDLGSSNGVRLNDQKIDKRARLGPKDRVRVGGFEVFLKRMEAARSSVTGRAHTRALGTAPAATAVPEDGPVRVAPPLAAEGPRLLGLDPPVRGRTFELQRGESIVGRLEECDVPILDGSVSRQHARLVYTRDRLTVTDLGSSNGVFVNDLRVDMAELAEADTLRVGNVSFTVKLPPHLAVVAPAPLATRAKVRPAGGERRWVTLGAVGLLLAMVVVVAAFVLQQRRRNDADSLFGLESTPDPVGTLSGVDQSDPRRAVPPPPSPAVPSTGPADEAAPDAGRSAGDSPAPAPPPPTVVAPVSPPPAATVAVLGPTGTATSPYTRRGPDGLPQQLPQVDETFDLIAFVREQLAAAAECESQSNFICMRAALLALLQRDPIHAEARSLLRKVDQVEAAEAALAEADRHVARGDYAQALRVLADAPREGPRAADVAKRADALKERAIAEELKRAASEARRRQGWKRAHRRYKYVLQLDPKSMVALEGLRNLERQMRRRKMSFTAYRPAPRGGRPPPPRDVGSDAIRRQYGGDTRLVKVATTYARGDLPAALRRAKRLAQGSGERATTARAMAQAMQEVSRRYDRTRTEISNDPDHAWAMLIDLDRFERRILPRGVSSYLVREVEASLSEAFAERGAALFDQGRFEDAFQRWESGFKLDDTNPKVLAGLSKLEAKADGLAKEAELAAQRGDNDVCDRWKRITRMTRSDAEIHKRARRRAITACR